MSLLALFSPFTHRNYRFPNPFTYFDLWNPYNFIYLKPEKGTPFGRSLPVWAIIGRVLGGFWNHCRLFRTGAQGWNSERKIKFFSIGMVAVIYHAIFLGDKGVNQSKVFAFCRIKHGFSQLFTSYLTGLAKITVCPGCRLAVTDEHISLDDWTEFLKSWLLILK